MTAAAKARAAAVHCEVKKHAYRQTQDGFVISFILHPQEVPEEMATAALGTRYIMALSQIGDDEMPVANEVPAPSCRSASSSGEREPESDPGLPAERGHKSPAQIAGYLCTLPSFHVFLREKFPAQWHGNLVVGGNPELCAKQCIYDICTVTSRRELTDKNTEWHALQLAFRLWQNHPELEDA